MRATLHIEAAINQEELRALDFDMLNLDTTATRGELVERGRKLRPKLAIVQLLPSVSLTR
jgi:hypothetical protein